MRRLLSLLLTAALGVVVAASPAAAGAHHSDVFRNDARPYGTDMATWGERASRWVYGQPYDRSPLFDPTGENCDVAQRGPVWYVARIAGPPVFSGTRECAVPRGRSLLLYIGAVVDTYPCPAFPDFRPAPGQSLYDFLAADAKFWMDTVDFLSVTIDGRPVRDVMSYRYASDDLFWIKGDPSLAEPFDPCITGRWQKAVVDGFFLMVKPLRPGGHTIVVRGTNTIGHDKTFTYHLTVG